MESLIWDFLLLLLATLMYHDQLCLGQLHNDDILTVRTSKGLVKGKLKHFPNGVLIQTYLGIPYAKPPVGKLRFKHPIPTEPWNGVLHATEYGDSCLQVSMKYLDLFPGLNRNNPKTTFSEDCLTLNVFVPHPRPNDSTVMVFIHGGGLSIGGSSAPFSDVAALAAQEGVITVSMNYRLASFGFMYLDHPEIDANCGLLDQVMALRWVNENIRQFGGNPSDVTLFGQSVGGISVGYHMMSKLSKGLFKRAILQSGSPLHEWLLNDKSTVSSHAYETGKRLGCINVSSTDALVHCLMKTEAKLLINSEPRKRLSPFVFKAVVDGYFFEENPIEFFKNKSNIVDKEFMTGVVENEGTLFLSLIVPFVFAPIVDVVAPYHEEFHEVVKYCLPNQSELLYSAIDMIYTDWDHFNNTQSNLRSSEEIISDYFFHCPMSEFLELQSSGGNNIYVYYFPYVSNSTNIAKWIGTPHAEELRYLMGEVLLNPQYTSEEKNFSRRLMRYWANFARFGNPNSAPNDDTDSIYWPKYTNLDKQVLVLAPDSRDILYRFETKRCKFWRTLYHQLKVS